MSDKDKLKKILNDEEIIEKDFPGAIEKAIEIYEKALNSDDESAMEYGRSSELKRKAMFYNWFSFSLKDKKLYLSDDMCFTEYYIHEWDIKNCEWVGFEERE